VPSAYAFMSFRLLKQFAEIGMDVIILEGILTLYFLPYLPKHDFFVIYHLKNGESHFWHTKLQIFNGYFNENWGLWGRS